MDSTSSSEESSLSGDWPPVPVFQAPAFQALSIRPRSFHLDSLERSLEAPPSLFTYVLEGSLCGVLLSSREGARVLLWLQPSSWLALACSGRGPHACARQLLQLSA
ncbi:unnamed protein product [Symbiodinium natans]|uniref:Uncharacterized protein n=1 Tax=Symbiodinium natans TaxID=878477 RepID=A0A812LXD2_9DINO|nr:unnamed protein product [Symbiodinium natans]